jgi:hypothetical protein
VRALPPLPYSYWPPGQNAQNTTTKRGKSFLIEKSLKTEFFYIKTSDKM